MTTQAPRPPAYLAGIPDHVLTSRQTGELARWLDAQHWRPTLAQLEAERARRGHRTGARPTRRGRGRDRRPAAQTDTRNRTTETQEMTP